MLLISTLVVCVCRDKKNYLPDTHSFLDLCNSIAKQNMFRYFNVFQCSSHHLKYKSVYEFHNTHILTKKKLILLMKQEIKNSVFCI